MALCEMQFRAVSIRKDTAIRVLLPDGEGPFPVLYLLHGLSDDYTKWHRFTSIERYVRDLPLIVVMPDGHRNFYVNDPRPSGMAYEDHIITDVVGMVDRTFRTVRRRTERAIAGLSMGGFGAMTLAMRHPDMFSVACSHSGAFHFPGGKARRGSPYLALAGALPKGKYDCFVLARKLKRTKRRLAIRFDCGLDDGLLERSRAFHAYLAKLGISHEYAEHPGAHNWAYWDEHIGETLAFVMKRLRAAKGT